MKYTDKNGGIHENELEYLKGLVIDLEGVIRGKNILINELKLTLKEYTGKSYEEIYDI